MGGSDDETNLISLTIEEHAQAHKDLYDKHGKYYDFIAWKTLSGQMSQSEAHTLARKHRDTSYMKTSEYRKKVSDGKKGKAPWNKGKTGCYTQTLESNLKRSNTLSRGGNGRAKRVIYNDITFSCIKDAAEYAGVKYEHFKNPRNRTKYNYQIID